MYGGELIKSSFYASSVKLFYSKKKILSKYRF